MYGHWFHILELLSWLALAKRISPVVSAPLPSLALFRGFHELCAGKRASLHAWPQSSRFHLLS